MSQRGGGGLRLHPNTIIAPVVCDHLFVYAQPHVALEIEKELRPVGGAISNLEHQMFYFTEVITPARGPQDFMVL